MICNSSMRTESIPNPVRESIQALLDYLWDDEERHFSASDQDNSTHIYSDLRTVRTWLESRGCQGQKCSCNLLHTVAQSANKSRAPLARVLQVPTRSVQTKCKQGVGR